MPEYTLITAIGTPLDADESLHIDGLHEQIDDQFRAGMTGLLVGGTMGLMQLLARNTYEQLVDESIVAARGRGEVLVGVGDLSLTRTLERVELLNQKRVDGVVALCPFLIKFSQPELVDYFSAVADASKHPLFLYDLPIMTGTKLSLDTVRALSRHPNINGIKCSCDFGWTRQLIDENLPDFRVIVAQAELIDVLFRSGVTEHLDGIFAAAPEWVAGIARAAVHGDWATAAAQQQKLIALLQVVRENGVFPAFTAIMNARGVSGNFAPKPYRLLDDRRTEALLQLPIIRELLATPRHSERTPTVVH
ncbi:MAG TPA: dihydrodipicolinate synthase family protein [Tepidisphaeraceae bacterium]|nr:dihydrodipicolinate synthase family protein [Tepidisphaeraceae bacterium]